MFQNAEEFLDGVFSLFYQKMHVLEKENYDADRFSFDNVDRSRVINIQEHKEYLKFFVREYALIFKTYQSLVDEESKNVFLNFILLQLLGNLHVKLKTNTPENQAIREKIKSLPHVPSSLSLKSQFGPLNHYELTVDGDPINVDCWWANIAYSFVFKQYYFIRENVQISPEPGDHVIDAGACFGVTSLAFANSVGPNGKVYSFDIMKPHFDVIYHNIRQNPQLEKIIQVFTTGLGDKDNSCNSYLPVLNENQAKPGQSVDNFEDPDEVPVTTVDTLVSQEKIRKVDFIKMDIEGYELKALVGATDTIKKYKPKLAISLYHKNSDIIDIPGFISDLNIGYKLFMDNYTIHKEETILYAI